MSQHTDRISKSQTYFILLLAKILLLSCSKPSNETSQLSDNVKLVSEIPLPTSNKTPESYFVKNGAVWVFENLDDEMGFVRIKID
ncbi:hypothetical protein ACFOUP_13905 [Belliella kenyensis]|uniref:Uncharacterized protein n=1 Tax=Belliella kenyensis TaxID=1472724 RepID=A0ABV8ENJ5_9BACT|nr:hypothetical protein [Belliella kenyensis]MCH7401537.1 hypothetical protein [Belliella kenyensis]MDN3603183.1 hypothetical protein [Belliella kenyensis]